MASIASQDRTSVLGHTDFQTVEVTIPHEPPARVRKRVAAGFLSREQVLAATAECFDELGYDGTTIRAIAARLGCAVGSIYRYCRDKRELLAACAAQMLQPVVDAMGDADSTFEQSAARYVEVVSRHSELYRLMFWIGDGNAGLPLVVKRILGGWSRMLGNVADARTRWALLHGSLMLGGQPGQIVEQVRGYPPPQPPAADPTTPPADDVTLL